MRLSENENLALMRYQDGTLTWESVWVEFLGDVISYLERESDFNGDGYEALVIIPADSIVDGADEYSVRIWPK